MKEPNFRIIHDEKDHVTIRDIGSWDQHYTVTNGPESVVSRLYPMLKDRRLLYYDSYDELGELIYDSEGKFTSFGLDVKL